jgi:hypothetical protein
MESAEAPRFRAAPLDTPARLALAAAGALIALALWWLVGIAADAPGRTLLHPAMLLAAGLTLLLAPATVGDWLRAPVGYSVEPGTLRIHRRHAPDVTFELTGAVERFPAATGLRRRGVFYGCRWIPERGNPGMRNAFKERGPSLEKNGSKTSAGLQRGVVEQASAVVSGRGGNFCRFRAAWQYQLGALRPGVAGPLLGVGGIEVEFRGLKQTLNRAKLRCRNEQRVLAELNWSIMAMAVAELFALKEQLDPADPEREPVDPQKRSLANTMRALRWCLTHLSDVPEPGQDLHTRLHLAVTDSYDRKSSKRARYRPPNPDKKPLGDPTVRELTPQEKTKLEDFTAERSAA